MRTRIGQTLGAVEIEIALAKKFAAPEYAFMPQLNEGTGAHAGRRADAVAFSLWPSRGLTLHGFEIKISRSDLASELKKPEKAEAISRFCDHWWIVTPVGLVGAGDFLPPTWGLIEVNGRGVQIAKQAPKLEAEPLSRHMIASMFRAFHGTVPQLRENFICADDLKDEIERRVTERLSSKRYDENHELSRLREIVKQFEEASGVKLDESLAMGDVGHAVKVVRALGQGGGVAFWIADLQRRLHAVMEHVEAARHAATDEQPTAEEIVS